MIFFRFFSKWKNVSNQVMLMSEGGTNSCSCYNLDQVSNCIAVHINYAICAYRSIFGPSSTCGMLGMSTGGPSKMIFSWAQVRLLAG